MIMLPLRLNILCNYVKAMPSSRMIESQSVINSSMIIMCGATVRMSDNIELYVLYLQTSASSHYNRNFDDEKCVKYRGNGKFR